VPQYPLDDTNRHSLFYVLHGPGMTKKIQMFGFYGKRQIKMPISAFLFDAYAEGTRTDTQNTPFQTLSG